MSKAVFKFKQFSIDQSKSAMKVGTDGVLLGAWANFEQPKTILDIGSGTGLISLMMAQRYPNAEITAIEINENAFQETQFNFSESRFSERCTAILSSLQNFRTDETFDFIVSNPPFFKRTHSEESARNFARQHSLLHFEELLFHTEKLLNSNGKAAFILPFENEAEFMKIAKKVGLFVEKITRVRGNENTAFKRSLLLLSRNFKEIEKNELIIETDRNVYTEDYIQLTKEFYLKM